MLLGLTGHITARPPAAKVTVRHALRSRPEAQRLLPDAKLVLDMFAARKLSKGSDLSGQFRPCSRTLGKATQRCNDRGGVKTVSAAFSPLTQHLFPSHDRVVLTA
jgi:hypothetical protein